MAGLWDDKHHAEEKRMKKVKENKDDEEGQHKLCSEKKNEKKTMSMNMMKM